MSVSNLKNVYLLGRFCISSIINAKCSYTNVYLVKIRGYLLGSY